MKFCVSTPHRGEEWEICNSAKISIDSKRDFLTFTMSVETVEMKQ
jgi:hypothetical protein